MTEEISKAVTGKGNWTSSNLYFGIVSNCVMIFKFSNPKSYRKLKWKL